MSDQSSLMYGLSRIVKDAVQALGAKRGGLYRSNNKDQCLEVIANVNLPINRIQMLQWGCGVCGRMISENADHQIVEDYDASPYRFEGTPKGEIKSLMAISIRGVNSINGVFFAEGPVVNHFQRHHLHRIKTYIERIRKQLLLERLDPGLLKELGFLQGMIVEAPVAIIATEKGRVTIFNQAAATMFGHQYAHVKNLSPIDLYADEEDARKIGSLLQQYGKVKDFKTWGKRIDGTTFPFKISAIRLGEKTSVGFFESQVDIAEERKRQEVLDGCVAAFSQATDFLSIQQTLSNYLKASFEADDCCIYLKDERYFGLTSPRDVDHYPKHLDDDIYRHLEEGRLITFDKKNPSGRKSQTATAFGLSSPASALIIPLVEGDKKLGVILLVRKYRDLDHEDLRLMKAISGHVAPHVARHWESEERARLVRWLQAFNEANTALVSGRKPDDIYDMMARHVEGAFEASWISVLMVDRQKKLLLQLKHGKGEPERWEGIREGGLTHQIISERTAIAVENIDQSSCHFVNPFVRQQGARSVLGVPIMHEGLAIGVLWCHFTEPRHFSTIELDTLAAYTRLAAATLVNLQHQEDDHKLVQSLTSMQNLKTVDAVLNTIARTSNHLLGGKSKVCVFDRLSQKSHETKPMDSGWEELTKNKLEETKSVTELDGIYRLSVNERWDCAVHPDQTGLVTIKGHERDIIARLLQGGVAALGRLRLLKEHRAWIDNARSMIEAIAGKNFKDGVFALLRVLKKNLKCSFLTLAFKVDHETEVFATLHQDIGEHYLTGSLGSFKHAHAEAAIWQEHCCETIEIWPGLNAVSYAAIPITFNKGYAGTLWIGFESYRPFTNQQKNDYILSSELIAVTLHLSSLNEKVDFHLDVFEAYMKTGKTTIHTLDKATILQELAEQTKELSKADLAEIWLLDEARERIKLEATSRELDLYVQTEHPVSREGDSKGILGRCLKQRKPINLGDVVRVPDYVCNHYDTQSELVVPIWDGDTVIGVLNIERAVTEAFTKELVTIIEVLALQVGVAIKSALAYEELYQIRGMVGSQSIQEFIKLMSGTWEHNINKEVGNARRKILHAKKATDDQDMLDLLQKANSALGRIADIPSIVPLTPGEQTECLDLAELIPRHFQSVWTNAHEDIELIFRFDPQQKVPILAGKNWVKRLFEMLTDNAVRAMRTTKRAHIFSITLTKQEGRAKIGLKDTGPGVSVKLQKKLFASPIIKQEGAHGMGVGLMLADAMARAYNGRLWLESSTTAGSEFCISFPLIDEEK